MDTQWLLDAQQRYLQAGWRLPLWCSGSPAFLSEVVQNLLLPGQQRVYWLGPAAPEGCTTLNARQKQLWLGSECDLLIINAQQEIDWDLVAASAGCLRAGGIWLLLTPAEHNWLSQPNPASKRVLSFPLDASSQTGRFQQFFIQSLVATRCGRWQEGQPPQLPTIESQVSTLLPAVSSPYKTNDQQAAVEAIHKVLSGHRRRPLLLSAHRGRGKSTALGIAAAQLIRQGKTQVLLTGPSPQSVQRVLQTTAEQLAAPYQSGQQQVAEGALQFHPIDWLLQHKPKASLLLVDEAAAIPTPQLEQLNLVYNRVVFSSTEHGYEGTGRGFQLKFRQHLQAQPAGFRQVKLQQPIRYQSDDPLEQLIFDAFLLQPLSVEAEMLSSEQLTFHHYQSEDLVNRPELLRQVFHLLSLAHYQTDIHDLWGLLEQPQQVYSLQSGSTVVACALVGIEGGFTQELVTQIAHGQRRVQGHLLAQSLAYHCAKPDLAMNTLARVQRIVVHPALQLQGLGSQLLTQCGAYLAGRVSYLGTSFGANPQLVRFWQKAGFLPVKLSVFSQQASAEQSVLMLKAFAPEQQAKVVALSSEFSQLLYWQLSDQQQKLNAELAAILCKPARIPLSSSQKQQLQLFADGLRSLALVEALLPLWLALYIQKLQQDEFLLLLISRYWQKQPLKFSQDQLQQLRQLIKTSLD
ncbi:GNAT family N-acetyltransferase [Rheinheimera marina]|uniref:tRNA(Met) cytidine acetyltransferase TmcA n=1 Tax=Rheinheimera marina TaxID=1774958 RepID=A0ABV9JRV8_9GAMM